MKAAKNVAIFAVIVAVILSGIMVYYKLSKNPKVIEVSEELVWHRFSARDMTILALDEKQGQLLSMNSGVVRRAIGKEGELTIICVDDKKLFYDFFEVEKTTMQKVGKETVVWLLWESYDPEDIIVCPSEPPKTVVPVPAPQEPHLAPPQEPHLAPPLTPPTVVIPPLPSNPPGPEISTETSPEENDEATEPSPEDNTPPGTLR